MERKCPARIFNTVFLRLAYLLIPGILSGLRAYGQAPENLCAVTGIGQISSAVAGVYSETGTDTFDVVFHILHLGQSVGTGSNITDEQVKSAILSLNRDYGAWPIHDSIAIAPNGTNSEFFFRLACTAPDGSVTSGINRIDASGFPGYATKGFNFKTGTDGNFRQLADLSHWPQDRYINIWITHRLETFTGTTSGGGGFNAQTTVFQQGYGGIYMVFRHVGCDVDGTLGFDIFNKYGRLISHETGHFLGLLHTFQGETCFETDCSTEGDRVCDTEPHPNSIPNDLSCNAFAECSTREPVENIMNYSGLDCGNIITPGQKARMKGFSYLYYQNMINQSGCAVSSTRQVQTTERPLFPNPVTYVLNLPATPDEIVHTVMIYDISGREYLSHSISETAQPGQIRVDGLPAGLYILHALDREGRPLYRSRFVRQ